MQHNPGLGSIPMTPEQFKSFMESSVAPPTTQGVPQSGPQAPECPFDTTWLYWCPTYSGVHYIGTHAGEYNGTRTHPVQVIRYALFEIQKVYTDEAKAKLSAAERRIAELEGEVTARGDAIIRIRAEGREAGIREAAEVARAMRDADTGPSEYAQGARQGLQLAGRRILALLAKKPEAKNDAMQTDLAHFTNAAFVNGHAEGRGAGVRVAIEWLRERAWNEAADMLSGHLATGDLLAKEPEGGK